MSYLTLSIFTDMITEVETQKAVFGFEYHQITNAILKYRDFFSTNRERYQIPQALLTELNGYIDEFPTIQFGDMDNARYQNPIVECLRIICQLVQYSPLTEGTLLFDRHFDVTVTPTQWYLSYLLKRWYKSYNAGFYDNFINGGHAWSETWPYWNMSTDATDIPQGYGYFVGNMEHWFTMNRNYGIANIYVKAWTQKGTIGNPNISIAYLTSGEPRNLQPANQRESILTRGDVTIKAIADCNYYSDVYLSEWNIALPVDDYITYVVVLIRDDFANQGFITTIFKVVA